MSWRLKAIVTLFVIAIIAMSVFSLSGKRPSNLGVTNGKLSACPVSPNCVSSDAADTVHNIAAISFQGDASVAWSQLVGYLGKQPQVAVIEQTDVYIAVEYRSAFMGFVDDLELHLRTEEQQIAVRSASRLGYSDFGVNRKRVESLRNSLTTPSY